MCMRVWICVAMLTLPGAPVLADGPDGMGQKSAQMTRLGMRLMPLAERNGMSPYDAVYWSEARAIIEISDAAKDASADTAAGHTGFMTHANDAIAESPVAPGLKCYDRSEASRRATFLFAYKAPVKREAGGALLAFDTYARRYNSHMLTSGALGETSCVAIGW